mgnify:CR=1 FL=1
MEIVNEAVKSMIVDAAEQERIALAEELGNNLQEKVLFGMTPRQMCESKKWVLFRDLDAFVDYLAINYSLFKTSKPDGLLKNKVAGNVWVFYRHIHSFADYPQRIPYGVLLKVKEAKDCGLSRFWIVDPDIENTTKGSDPFLLGQMPGENSLNYYLICSWDDKKA